MRKQVFVALISTALLAQPALAGIGIGDLAGVILKGNAVLKKGETKCGSSLALTPSENLTLSSAVAAAKRALAKEAFAQLDGAAQTEANTQAQSTTFCNDTKAKKPGILSGVGKAAKSILKGGLGGLKI